MKKLSMVLALVLVTALCAVCLTACGGYSGDPQKDKEALEKKGYKVTVMESGLDEGQTAALTAIKTTPKVEDLTLGDLTNPDTIKNLKVESISILYCKDADTAKKACDEAKKALEGENVPEFVKKTKISQSGNMVISEVTVTGEDAADYFM